MTIVSLVPALSIEYKIRLHFRSDLLFTNQSFNVINIYTNRVFPGETKVSFPLVIDQTRNFRRNIWRPLTVNCFNLCECMIVLIPKLWKKSLMIVITIITNHHHHKFGKLFILLYFTVRLKDDCAFNYFRLCACRMDAGICASIRYIYFRDIDFACDRSS